MEKNEKCVDNYCSLSSFSHFSLFSVSLSKFFLFNCLFSNFSTVFISTVKNPNLTSDEQLIHSNCITKFNPYISINKEFILDSCKKHHKHKSQEYIQCLLTHSNTSLHKRSLVYWHHIYKHRRQYPLPSASYAYKFWWID